MTLLNVPAEALRELDDLYHALDVELQALGVSCNRCGKCCDFVGSGLFLFMGTVEAARFYSIPPPVWPPETYICPFVVDNHCTNRTARSIGCRTYFCNPALREDLQAMHEKYLRLTRDICDRYSIPWRYLPVCQWTEELHPLADPQTKP